MDETKLHDAALRLAKAAANLRSADDALVSFGVTVMELPDEGHPERDGRLAVERCQAVALAYREMREAEAAYERLAHTRNPLR